ncbi:alpha-mannosidase [Clostridium sp. USBA 49]|uniref:alpha-mannosidase n=1 Tax=Clostridium sp. USBA 49 TaxID=1881060 RepID=UPI00099B0F4D|nr:alpha-mannosidase [Clostridium sp. USBA 49]SKA85346.1 alpha-mannosidase [Clostridium sp. USBA 49]
MNKDNKKTLHMIGNSHIDPVWLWRWQEGFQEVKATFSSVLDRMNEYPDFNFTASSIVYYKWIEDIDPEMFEKIKKRVKEGRWQIVGGWFVEPDCNIPSGESFVRQALYSQRYLKKTFGDICTIGYNIDSFGHNAMLPQILKKSGFKYYLFMRPVESEKHIDSPLFKWKSEDGSTIITCRLPGEYTAWFKEHILKNIEKTLKVMKNYNEMLCFYGVGNHGGGPTIQNINTIYELKKDKTMPKILFSTVKDFFSKVDEQNLPEYKDEIQHHSVGCYSADSELKRLNRKAENVIIISEKLGAMANMLGNNKNFKYDIEKIWEVLLFNQFHDILAGTSIEEARNDAVSHFNSVISKGKFISNTAIQAIANKIDTLGEGYPLILFNTNSYEFDEWADLEIAWDCKKALTIVDDLGNEVPYQRTRTSAATTNVNFGGRRRVVFKVNIPAFGYRVYRIFDREPSIIKEDMKVYDNILENKNIKVIFNKQSGNIRSIYDKRNKFELLKGEIIAKVIKDESDTWSHGIKNFNEVIGNFELVDMRILEKGCNRAIIKVTSKYGESKLEQFYTLYEDADYIRVKNYLNWQEKHKILKISMPINVENPKFICEIPYGYLNRDSYEGHEEFAHSWVKIEERDKNYGVVIANDSKYAYDMTNNVYNMTICRSPVYAHHDPAPIEEDVIYRYMDQGEQIFSFVISFDEKCGNVKANKLSDILNVGYEYLIDTYHKGEIKAQNMSLISLDKENIIVEVLKTSEDDNGYILRMYEIEGSETKTELSLKYINKKYNLVFSPCEIKTILITRENEDYIYKEVNMLEV